MLASPFASPSNAEIKRHLSSVKKGAEMSVSQMSHINIGKIKDFKVN
jgi:hypothetical protein